MNALMLQADNDAEIRVKQYLETASSDVLAEKINNGVRIIKDNKEFISKKNLKGFMKYALEKARETAQKGAIGTCVDDKTVFGWAIHYFEEDSIEGKLYNLDGTEYKPEATSKSKPKQKEIKPAVKQNPQQNMFDIMFNNEETKVEDNNQQIKIDENLIVDQETGIIETSKKLNSSFDEQITILLCSILGEIVEII